MEKLEGLSNGINISIAFSQAKSTLAFICGDKESSIKIFY